MADGYTPPTDLSILSQLMMNWLHEEAISFA